MLAAGAHIIAFLNKADWIYERIEELGEVQFCLQETSCAKEFLLKLVISAKTFKKIEVKKVTEV